MTVIQMKNFQKLPASVLLAAAGKPAPQSGFEQRAVSVLEEAIALGTLPLVKLDGEVTLDLRSLPPNVAEVYVLTVMGQLQRRRDPRCAPPLPLHFL